MDSNYWELVTKKDGLVIEIPPEMIATVRRKMDNHDPIHTAGGSIPYADIVTFRPTEKSSIPLLDATAQAFDEAVLNQDGSIVYTWVKKVIPQNVYQKQYMGLPAYRTLDSDTGMVTIAFKLPIHSIDVNTTVYCTEDESQQLDKRD